LLKFKEIDMIVVRVYDDGKYVEHKVTNIFIRAGYVELMTQHGNVIHVGTDRVAYPKFEEITVKES